MVGIISTRCDRRSIPTTHPTLLVMHLCMTMAGSTLVLGASTDPGRYAYLATERLLDRGHPVVLIGRKAGQLRGNSITKEFPDPGTVHTVTLYVNPIDQEIWHERILALAPRRIIFNPGTEHDGFADRAKEQGIEVVVGCTLVMLGSGQY